ncbi:MAG TPA: carbohydrate ABC transporter permease [Deinococcales bacterium]|nr:carbohydrate ABC transporter permease [Deinococcales bacterium]
MSVSTARRPRRFRFSLSGFFSYVGLIILGALMAFPFVWMLITSFKPKREILKFDFFPSRWTLENFQDVLFRTDFPRWFLNSFVVASITTICVLFFCALVGYTLARMRFPGKEVVFILILSTMMIPTEMLIIPWFVMSAEFGWTSTYWGIMFPGLITGFGVFLLRQFFQTLPMDLFDAGRIDGLSEFGLFWRVGLPLVGPGLSALGIFTFIGNWNAFLWPLVVITDRSMRTIPVGVALFSGEAGTDYNLIMAASALAIIPLLIIFIIFQKQIVEGVVLTGVKG